MKTPEGLLDTSGNAGKGDVTLSSSNDVDLREFGTVVEGSTTTCYALTSPNDVITVRFAFNPNVAAFVDLVVDGVRRASSSTEKSQSIFRGSFNRVCHLARTKSDKRAGLKLCLIQVKSRDSSKDVLLEDDSTPSAVGSLAIQVFQKGSSNVLPKNPSKGIPEGAVIDPGSPDLGQVERAPAFDTYATWCEVPNSHIISQAGPPPPFEIDLIEEKKGVKSNKDKVLKPYSAEYKLWATFIFHLRSTADLKILGFENVPSYYAAEYIPSASDSATKKSSRKTSKSRLTNDGDATTAGEVKADKQAGKKEGTVIRGTVTVGEAEKPNKVKKAKTPKTEHEPIGPQQTREGLLYIMANSRQDDLEAAESRAFADAGAQPTISSSDRDNKQSPIEEAKNKSTDTPDISPSHLSEDTFYTEGKAMQTSSRPTAAFSIQSGLGITMLGEATSQVELLKSETLPAPPVTNQKGSTLPGLSSAPAHKAWLERGSTQETEAQPATPIDNGLSQMTAHNSMEIGSDPRVVTIAKHAELDNDAQSHNPDSQPDEAITPVAADQAQAAAGYITIESPNWEIMTPPGSLIKPHIDHPNRAIHDEFGRMVQNTGRVEEVQEKAKYITGGVADISLQYCLIQKVDMRPLATPTAQCTTTTETLAQTLPTNDPRTEFTPLSRSAHGHQIIDTNLDVAQENVIHAETETLKATKAMSEASNATTEVADLEHVIESVRKSHHPNSVPSNKSSLIETPKLHMLPSHLSSRVTQSPEVKSTSHLLRIHTNSKEAPGIAAQQVRSHWEDKCPSPPSRLETQRDPAFTRAYSQSSNLYQTPTNQTQVPHYSPQSQRQNFTHNPSWSFTQGWVNSQSCPFTPSPSPKPHTKSLSTQKRKSEDISNALVDSTESREPRKLTVAQASAKTEGFEKEKLAAIARIEAAEARKKQLTEKYQAALLVQEQREKVKEMNLLAAEVERKNAEMEAQIATIYGAGSFD